MQRILASTALMFATLLLAMSQVTAELRIEITETAGVQDKVPVAVVPFAQDVAGLGVDIAEIITDDLLRSGRFTIVPRDRLPGNPASSAEVVFSDWQDSEVEYLVVGRVRDGGSGRLEVDFELVDVVKQTRLLAYPANAQGQIEYCCRYQINNGQLRRTAHTIANLVYEQVYGVPDGEQIAYVSFEFVGRTAIIVHDLARAERRKLISIEGINGAPAWSPDGRRLALSLSHRGSPDIYIVNVASGQLSQLTTAPSIETEATWLDNNTVAFTSNRSGSPQIYRKGLSSGSVAERVTFEGNYNAGASASPDGTKIAFIHNDSGNFRIAVQDLNNNVLEVLTDGRLDESPSFSPNGDQILYSTKDAGVDVLGVVSVDGLVEQKISLANENVRDPAWGPRR